MALVDRPRRSIPFRDISFQFLKHPVTDDIGAFTNEGAIKRAVQNLVRTRYGERFFEPLLGSTVEDSLFESADEFTADSIDSSITTLLENFEPRIANIEVRTAYPVDSNEISINVRFDIVGLDRPTQEIDFIFQSTRV